MALTIGAWVLAGYQSYGLVASLGVFTILYCTELHRTERALVLPLVGAGLVLSCALGVVCSANVTTSVAGLMVVTLLSTALTLGFETGPPGPLMFVLVSGVSGYIAHRVREGGTDLTLGEIPILAATGALVAYVVVIAPLALPGFRKKTEPHRPLRSLFRFRSFSPQSQLIAVRVLIATFVAALIGAYFGVQRVYWIVVPAVAILQKSHSSEITTSRALHRVLGTVLGLGAFALVRLLEPKGVGLVALIAGFQFIVELVVGRNYGLGLVFITPLALSISTAGKSPDLRAIMEARVLDTLLGAAVALAVLWLGEWLRRAGKRKVTVG